ncbi:MAG TPA: DUF1844 domain-containing protein [Nitrospiria bacterium]|nr:DUF1844 domain-containing protein [Nitrospiria bacterium]
MPEEREEEIKVQDKRRFSPDTGELRDDAPKEEPKKEEAKKAAPSPESPKKEAPRQQPQAEAASGPMPEANLSGIILGLATQALALLGEISETPGAPPQKDLPSARHLIDILGVLQVKTKGNLDEAETKLLEHTLHDLRMRYVEATKK